MIEFLNTNQQSSNTIKIVFLIIAGLVLPLFLIPLVKFTGYSEIVEEITKAWIVLFLILKFPSYKSQIFNGIVFGFLFGMSENFLYLNNIFQLGDFSIFWQRFFYTIPMHIITVLVMVFTGLICKKINPTQKFFSAGLIFLGLAGAIILHVLFNEAVKTI